MNKLIVMIVGVARAVGRSYARWSTGAPVLLDNAGVERRQRTCLECAHRQGIFCEPCACLIRVKTQLRSERCPVGFWLDEI